MDEIEVRIGIYRYRLAEGHPMDDTPQLEACPANASFKGWGPWAPVTDESNASIAARAALQLLHLASPSFED